jgi:hypothetical protein
METIEQELRRTYPNKIERLEIDLSIARTDEEIASRGISFSVIRRGTGSWQLTFTWLDKTTTTFNSDELSAGVHIDAEYKNILFTNTAQAGVTNPIFTRGYRIPVSYTYERIPT